MSIVEEVLQRAAKKGKVTAARITETIAEMKESETVDAEVVDDPDPKLLAMVCDAARNAHAEGFTLAEIVNAVRVALGELGPE